MKRARTKYQATPAHSSAQDDTPEEQASQKKIVQEQKKANKIRILQECGWYRPPSQSAPQVPPPPNSPPPQSSNYSYDSQSGKCRPANKPNKPTFQKGKTPASWSINMDHELPRRRLGVPDPTQVPKSLRVKSDWRRVTEDEVQEIHRGLRGMEGQQDHDMNALLSYCVAGGNAHERIKRKDQKFIRTSREKE